MNNVMAKVSVIIPTYNSSKFLSHAIESALSQTYKDLEIIVVDDGSIDNTYELVNEYNGQIRYIYQENKGLSAARNTGIKESSGDYIAFLDSDDVWFSEKLSLQINAMQDNAGLGLVGSLMEVIDDKGRLLGRTKPTNPPGYDFETALINGSPPPSSFLIRRRCLDKVGYFDENLGIFEDLDLFLRISRTYGVKTLDRKLGGYRIHSSNMTKNDVRVYSHQIILAKKWLRCSLSNEVRNELFDRVNKYAMISAKQNLKNLRVQNALKFLFIAAVYTYRRAILTV